MTKYIDKFIDWALFVILAVMSFSMAINVFCRFILRSSITWADELSQSLLLWLTFLGAAAVIREHTHYSFNYLETVFKGAALKIYASVNKLITLGAVILLFYWSVEVSAGISSWIMPAMEINRLFVYGACPVGCAFMIYYCIADLINFYRS
jgi:TRAP-type C4-dicarboxylate transport system permease small subunit